MTGTGEYRDGVALWSAAASRAKTEAKETGVSSHALLRRFVFDRFLARVFHDPSSPWVLKGGTAVLARVHDARTTKDVDLFHELNSLDAALEALRVATTDVHIDDHFRFVITKIECSLGGGQPEVEDPFRDGGRGVLEALDEPSFDLNTSFDWSVTVMSRPAKWTLTPVRGCWL